MDFDSTTFVVSAVTVGAVVLGTLLLARWRSNKPTATQHKKDVVYLHIFNRSRFTPSLSPFCLKLETYLRMSGVAYEPVFGVNFSSKGKLPWIELNGNKTADSSFCVNEINKHFGIDLDANLTQAQRATAHAFKIMIEEHLHFSITYIRWIENIDLVQKYLLNIPFPLSLIIPRILQNKLKATLHGQGIGRHTREEIFALAFQDLQALSVLLGEQQFMFGDQPTSFDATAFGFLANCVWTPFLEAPQKKMVEQDLPNLMAYITRMRERVWPDWDQLCAQAKI